MSPLMVQYMTIGVGVWLSFVLMIVGYLVLKNVVMQKSVLQSMNVYLARQTKQLDYICMLNSTMVRSLERNREKTLSLEQQLQQIYGMPPGARVREMPARRNS